MLLLASERLGAEGAEQISEFNLTLERKQREQIDSLKLLGVQVNIDANSSYDNYGQLC